MLNVTLLGLAIQPA